MSFIIPFTNQSFQLFTCKKQVKTLEDLQGMKIRSSGGVMDDYITALGAIPVQISFNECYEALSRGTVDGIIISAAGAEQADLLETVSYLTTGLDIPGGIYGFAFNEDVWQSYPDDIKEILLEAGKLANENSGKVLDEYDAAALEHCYADMEVYDLPEDEHARWVEVMDPVEDQWLAEMEAEGMGEEAKQVLEDIRTPR